MVAPVQRRQFLGAAVATVVSVGTNALDALNSPGQASAQEKKEGPAPGPRQETTRFDTVKDFTSVAVAVRMQILAFDKLSSENKMTPGDKTRFAALRESALGKLATDESAVVTLMEVEMGLQRAPANADTFDVAILKVTESLGNTVNGVLRRPEMSLGQTQQ